MKPFGTFGLYRFYLSCMVMWCHSGPGDHLYAGYFAVFAFYILSGYVVSYILHDIYLPKPNGLRHFALNRFLRIFPLYWAVFAFSFYLVTRYPSSAEDINWFFGIPTTAYGWIINITTFGMVNPLLGTTAKPLVLPLGWSLGIELLFWMLLPSLMRSRPGRIAMAVFTTLYTASVIYFSISYDSISSLPIRYLSSLAATLPFFTGLLIFRRKLTDHKNLPFLFGALALITHVVLMLTAPRLFEEPNFTAFYLMFALSAVITLWLSQIDPRTLHPLLRRADYALGNLSYPLYLIHMPTAILLHAHFPGIDHHSDTFTILQMSLSILFAWALHAILERPINKLRQKIKSRG